MFNNTGNRSYSSGPFRLIFLLSSSSRSPFILDFIFEKKLPNLIFFGVQELEDDS